MFQQRVNNIQKKLIDQNLDGLLISNFYNILYLTGFKTLTKEEREVWVLVTKKNSFLFTDGRYFDNLKTQNHRPKTNSQFFLKLITLERGLVNYLKEIVNQEKISRVGFEVEDLRVNELRALKKKLPGVKFIPREKLIIKEREIKTAEEVEKIKKACLIGDQCLRQIIKTIKQGQTEKEISFKIEFFLKKRGYDLAFSPLVAIDENSAIPHYDTASNGRKKVKNGSLILIDFGVNYKNYLSDITRMVFFGKPTSRKINIYQKLLSVQENTIKQSNQFNKLSKVDEFCRQQIINYGLPNFSHSTGHGVGLEIHEYPKISVKSGDILKPNQVFTIEPGVYFPGQWGMRIEDTVYIKDNQIPEILTQFSKKPLILSDRI